MRIASTREAVPQKYSDSISSFIETWKESSDNELIPISTGSFPMTYFLVSEVYIGGSP